MDSGLLEPEYESFDALKPRLPEEIIGIMDHLLCHEVGSMFDVSPNNGLLIRADGMAYGACSFTNALHMSLYR